MDAEEALDIALDYLEKEELAYYLHKEQCWYSSLPLYANSDKLPDPPKLPLRLQKEEDW